MLHTQHIDVIDFHSKSAKTDLLNSLQETGFAVFKSHPLDLNLISDVYAAWTQAFKNQELQNFHFDNTNFDGFVSEDVSETAKGFDVKDLKTFYNYYQWGKCPSHLQDITDEYFKQIIDCGLSIAKWLYELTPKDHLPHDAPSFIDNILNSNRNLLRINYFPALTKTIPAGAIRAQAHTDINFFTLIPRTSSPGLQVQHKNGDWLDVPYHKDWMVMNIGDMLQELTNGFWPSTMHRVINPTEGSEEDRMSTPLFFHPHDETFLSNRYQTSKAFLQERNTEVGLVEG